MKGKNLVKTPGELYAPIPGGTVVSADGVRDYNQNKNQETINTELTEKIDKALEDVEDVKRSNDLTANVVKILEEHQNDDLGEVLQLNERVGTNEQNISGLKTQLGNYNIRKVTEAEYEAMSDAEKDENTLYFIEEAEE